MKTSLFSVNKNICAECSLALRRFIGGLDGVASIDAQQVIPERMPISRWSTRS